MDKIEKIKKLRVFSKAENKWEGTKFIPFTRKLVELDKVLEILTAEEAINSFDSKEAIHKKSLELAKKYIEENPVELKKLMTEFLEKANEIEKSNYEKSSYIKLNETKKPDTSS